MATPQPHGPPPPYSRENTIRVVLAGTSGAGKSTLMKEVFGFEDLEGEMSAERGTNQSYTREKVKEGVRFVITDTVGLHTGDAGGSAGRQEELKRLSSHLHEKNEGKNDLLLYCLSVDVSSRFNNGNPAVMKSLQFAFGKDIWKKCVLVLTFSNNAYRRLLQKNGRETATRMYREHINKYATMFEDELKRLGNNIPVKVALSQVEPITAPAPHPGQAQPPPPLPPPQISAIPAGEMDADVVYPGISDSRWKDIFIHNLITSSNIEQSVKECLLQYQYGRETAKKTLSALVGAGIGGGVGPLAAAAAGTHLGAYMGAIGGPWGIGIGAATGGAIGLAAAHYHSAKNM